MLSLPKPPDWLLRRITPPGWVIVWVTQTGSLRGVDLSGRDLTGANFERSTLNDARFRGARLRHGDFSGADCEGSNFSRVNFSSCSGDVYKLENSKRPWTPPAGFRSRQGEIPLYGKPSDLFNALGNNIPPKPLDEI